LKKRLYSAKNVKVFFKRVVVRASVIYLLFTKKVPRSGEKRGWYREDRRDREEG
jgi:hypothetical protein